MGGIGDPRCQGGLGKCLLKSRKQKLQTFSGIGIPLVTKGDGAVDFSPVTFHAVHFRTTTTNIDVSSAHYSYHRHPAIRVVAPNIDTHSIANSNRGQGPITPIFMLEVKGGKSGMYLRTCYLVFTFTVPLENGREDSVKNREPGGGGWGGVPPKIWKLLFASSSSVFVCGEGVIFSLSLSLCVCVQR
jgi:hypothetical protein